MESSHFGRESHVIESPRLRIRTAKESDTEAFYKLLMTPENYPYGDMDQGLTLEKLRTRIGRFAESTARGENGWIVTILLETGELIGHGGYNTFESVKSTAFLSRPGAETPSGKMDMTDIGIMIDHNHWRKGYGLEMLSALFEHAKSELGCELFRTETDDDNGPWRALMRSAGLAAFEGRNRASYDQNIEVWVWKFDAEDWEEAKAKMKREGKWLM